MKYHISITKRTERLKQTYQALTVPMMADPYHPIKYKPFGTGDRLMTLGYLRGYEKHARAETVRLRASYAEAEELYQSKPIIFEDELLLGHLYLPEYTEEEQAEYDRLCDKFSIAVQLARLTAKSGQRVLLSPASASFDEFTGYEERGDKFVELVRSFEEKAKSGKDNFELDDNAFVADEGEVE